MPKLKKLGSGTCIAVIKTKRGKIMMAGDRRMSWGFSQAQRTPEPKVIKRDGLLFGGTGSCYLLTLINQIFVVPDRGKDDPLAYMHNIFHKALVRFLCSKGFGDSKTGVLKFPPDLSIESLVACKGRLFSILIGSDGDSPHDMGYVLIDEVSLPYSTGCGGSLAWGSLLTTEPLKEMSDKEKLITALKVAATVSPGCDDEVDIITE